MATNPLIQALLDLVPTGTRTFVSSMAGSNEPITEKNFKPEELEYIRQQVMEQRLENARRAEGYAQMNAYARAHEGQPRGVELKDGEYRELQYQKTDGLAQLQSYGKNPAKTSVSYDRYPEAGRDPTVRDIFFSPGYNVMTTLGQYNAFEQSDGTTRVEDRYNWTKPSTEGMSLADKLAIFGHAKNLEEFGNVAARLIRPTIDRPVEINLGKLPGTKSQKK